MSNDSTKKEKIPVQISRPLIWRQSFMTRNHDRKLEKKRILSEIRNNPKLCLLCYDCGTDSNVLDQVATHECLECIPQLKRLCKSCTVHHHRSGSDKHHVPHKIT